MNRLNLKIIKSEYFKSIYNQAILVFIAQLIPVIFSPLIARLYDENAIAEITGLISLSSILIVFSSLKIENAIVLAKDDKIAKEIIFLTLTLSLIYFVIMLGVTYVFRNEITDIFKIDNIINFVPFYILSFSLLNILNFWFVRLKKFKLKAYSKVLENLSYIVFALILYFFIGDNQYGLAAGKIIGVFLAFFILFKYSTLNIKRVSLKRLKELLIIYKEFPLFNAPSNFFNTIGLQLLVLFIGGYFSKDNFGYFGLANMIILLSISFVSKSVGSIFFQKITENYNLGNFIEVKKTLFETLSLLLAIAVPIFVILFFWAEEIFSLVFGDNWIVSGKIAKYLSFVFLFQLTISPIGISLIAGNKVKINSYWQYGRFLFLAIVMYITLNKFEVGFLNFIKIYSFSVSFVYLIYFIIILYQINQLDISKH